MARALKHWGWGTGAGDGSHALLVIGFESADHFAAALRGAKAAVDPSGLLNPGVLIDPSSEP